MLICPSCKAVLKEVPRTGKCPKCGKSVQDIGVETEGPKVPTLDVTQAFSEAPEELKAKTERPEVTMTQDLSIGEKRRSVNVAPRRLSAKNVELITNTWQGALSDDANPRSSLKLDSRSASGMGSSLVVNLRGVRNPEEIIRPAVGADYELLQVIGKGGMGVVYSARQASVDRLVALKMIRPNVAADAERREKFLSEAVVTGDLDHPNIVPIYELGTDEQNSLFYSMKQVQGTPWSHVIAKKTLSENLEILMKVADAVAFAHANGVVHRDLKPENVMLGDFGEVLVMDWGLALATATFRHSEFVTRTDSMGGTPAYMAPEMVTGPFELIGPPCDIYLLGALLFEVITGMRPHHGKNAQECLLAAARNDIQPTEHSGELIEIAYHAMATDPAERHASVQEFQSAIREYHSHMESVSLANRAEHELTQARRTGDYQGFAHALFGFEEALALWDRNPRAPAGISAAKLAYATCARQKGDFELGISLLDADDPEHAPLRAELEAGQRERNARQKWLSRFKRIAAALVVIVFGVVSVALVIVFDAKNRETSAKQQAILDRDSAEKARLAADQAREEEEKQKVKALAAEKRARQEEEAARAAENVAKAAQEQERQQKVKAIAAEQTAEAEREKALAAKVREEQAAYGARIGMAAAKIEENAFDTANNLLEACVPENLRHWEWGYLTRLCDQGRNFPATGTVRAVAFAPDGQWFVTAGQDKAAHLWDRQTGKQRLSIEQPGEVHAVAVSPDGKHLAVGGDDGIVRLYRVADGAPVGELAGHKDRVLGVQFSPGDGRRLVSCSRDNTACVWDTARSERPFLTLQGHYGWVWSAAFSPDATRIVTAGEDGRVIVWRAEPGAAGDPAFASWRVFEGHSGPVYTAAFSPDGRRVASGGYDRRVLVWQPDKIAEVPIKQLVALDEPIVPQERQALVGHSAPVRAITFSPDGEYLLSGSDDNTVRIWEAMTGRAHAALRGHSRPVYACAMSPDALQVVSGGQEGQIKLWDIVNFKEAPPEGRVLTGHEDAILAATFSRDGRRVLTASRDHSARVYEADSGQCSATLHEGHGFLAAKGIYFHNGQRLLTAGGDNTSRIWDAAAGTQLQVLENTGRNAAIAVSSDSNWLLTGKYVLKTTTGGATGDPFVDEAQTFDPAQPQITLWDLDAERKAAQPRSFADPRFGTGHPAIVTAVAISPDQKLLFSGDDAGMGKLWDSATGAELRSLTGHTAGITAASFLPGGRRLLTASKDGTVAQWDTDTGLEVRPGISLANAASADAFETPVRAIALVPDGRQVITLSDDTQAAGQQTVVRLWNLADALLVRELYRGPDHLTSLDVTRDGQAVLSAGERHHEGSATGDSIVYRWNLADAAAPAGAPLLDFSGRGGLARAAIEGPAGGVLTIGGNGAALWSVDRPEEPQLVFRPHGGLTTVAFSASGQKAVTGSSDRRVKVWNVATGLAELQLPAERARVVQAEFSPTHENLLLTASGDGSIRLWDVAARRVLRTLKHGAPGAGGQPLRTARFSPDGRQAVSGGDDLALHLWNLTDGKRVATIETPAKVQCAAFSSDGGRIIAGLSNGQAVVYDVASGQPIVRFSGHTDLVESVAISADGRRALTGSRDRLAKVWDIDTPDASTADVPQGAAAEAGIPDGKELLTLRYHDEAVSSVSFSPDGRSVLTASLDGTAVLWLTDDWQSQ